MSIKNSIKKMVGMELKNYVNVRIETSSHPKELNDIKHNTRKNDSLQSLEEDRKNVHFILDESQNKWKGLKDGDSYDKLKDKLKYMRKEHGERFYKRTKTKLRDRNSTFLNCVLTFSEKVKDDLENGKLDKNKFHKAGMETFKDLAKEMNTELIYLSVHYDETTPHFQGHFKNYDEQGNSIFFKNRTKDKLSKLQDVGIRNMVKFDNTMQRGIKKNRPIKNIRLKDYFEEEKAKHIDKLNSQIERYRATLKDEMRNLKEVRKEVKDLDLQKEEKKKLYNKISSLQKEVREQQKELRDQEEELNKKDNEISNLKSTNKSLNYDVRNLEKLKKEVEKQDEILKSPKKMREQIEFIKEKTKKEFDELLSSAQNQSNIVKNLDNSQKNSQISRKNHFHSR